VRGKRSSDPATADRKRSIPHVLVPVLRAAAELKRENQQRTGQGAGPQRLSVVERGEAGRSQCPSQVPVEQAANPDGPAHKETEPGSRAIPREPRTARGNPIERGRWSRWRLDGLCAEARGADRRGFFFN
jgi:hypothetical protein